MLMVMFVIAMLQMRYESQAKTLPDLPLNWGGENAYTYGHHALRQKVTEAAIKRPFGYPASHIPKSPESLGLSKSTNHVIVDMKPCLKVARCDSSECKLNKSDESNLEQWRSQTQIVKIEDLAPQLAVEKVKQRDGLFGFEIEQCSHCPWHLDIQLSYPDNPLVSNVLLYEITKSPTLQNPNYEAIVCAMPNIRCKAKSVELLQEQLLKQYADYLGTLLEDNVPVSTFPDENRHPRYWMPKRYESDRSSLAAPRKVSGQLPSFPAGYLDLPDAYRYLDTFQYLGR